ncbi:hypothetical protein ACHHYP_02076 [Achlya hypogyna]|uniref:Uncharacterized protein n=1 Tax=Achlya hypogyna TaxID=1202772 RepID=A0A1V9ZSG7_ACHHY|nr:hypothetical protein ACHHYP_02076 [Achlya hypogyna]
MEFAALSRAEQKAMLKAWNAKAARIQSSSSHVSRLREVAVTTGDAQPVAPRNEATTPNEVLTSVAAIQASYRGRQRQQESFNETLVKRTNQYKTWQRLKEEGQRRRSTPNAVVDVPHPPKRAEDAPEEVEPQAADPLSTDENPLHNVSYTSFTRDADFKQQILTSIRAELLLGKDVHLQNDMAVTGDTLSDTRLVLQQLCVASLTHCVRDQDLVPAVRGNLVEITLHPKPARV